MNLALIGKTIRDHRLLFLLALAASVFVPVLVIVALSSTPTGAMTKLLQAMPFLRDMFRMLVGADPLDMLSRTSFAAFTFVHPVVLAIVWGFLIVICTAVPASEVDRGTADLLLSLPISRRGIYLSVTSVVLLCVGLLAVAPWLGSWLSEHVKTWKEPLELGRLWLPVVGNVAALWAVAGVCLGVSSCCSRRGAAVGILFVWLLGSFMLNLLGAFWKPAERVVFLSLLNYFRPVIIVRDQTLNLEHVGVLVGLGLVGWVAGLIVFTRRDIATV